MPANLPHGLIVSCQAEVGSPFNSPSMIAAFAEAAALGGASGLRLRDVENIRTVRAHTTLPIIGITKSSFADGSVLITPDFTDIEGIVEAGADIVALDVTGRIRPNGLDGPTFLREVRKRIAHPLFADISTFDEGVAAIDAGADYVGTTLSGYSSTSKKVRTDVPDFELIERLAKRFPNQVVAEGRIWTPEQMALAFRLGACAVVVGSAITRPIDVVKRFVAALP